MKTFTIEYETPPLRAIYYCEVDADSDIDARMTFVTEMPQSRIRKICEKPKLEEVLKSANEKITEIQQRIN